MPTFGQSRVRISFNPAGNSKVDQIKSLTAELIDLCQTLVPTWIPEKQPDPELERLVELAQKSYEEAAMWAVKAATS